MTTLLFESPVDDLTRRRLLGGTGALGVLTVLAGCGAEQATAPSAATDGPFR